MNRIRMFRINIIKASTYSHTLNQNLPVDLQAETFTKVLGDFFTTKASVPHNGHPYTFQHLKNAFRVTFPFDGLIC